MPADSGTITGDDCPPIPEQVRRVADAAISAATFPGTHRIGRRYLAWLEQETAITRRALGLDKPHVMSDGRELVFTPVDGGVNLHQRQNPNPMPRAVGVLALIGLLEDA